MILSEAIINCRNYEDTEEMMYSIYAQRMDGKFQPNSEALVLELTIEKAVKEMQQRKKDADINKSSTEPTT